MELYRKKVKRSKKLKAANRAIPRTFDFFDLPLAKSRQINCARAGRSHDNPAPPMPSVESFGVPGPCQVAVHRIGVEPFQIDRMWPVLMGK